MRTWPRPQAMHYYRYITKEHARMDIGGEMVAFYEIADDSSFVRSLEIYADGVTYSYDQQHAADEFGILPDALMDVEAAAGFGAISDLSKDEFEQIWRDTKGMN